MPGTDPAAVPAGVPAQRPGPRRGGRKDASRWTVLAVLCGSLLLVAVDATVLHVAVPAVTADLRPGPVELLWIVDAYPLACAALLILFGSLGDRIGRRRVLLLGYAVFGLASALAVLAQGPGTLVAARALLGAGGAMIMPATLSLLRHVFPDRRERALAIGVWSAVAAVGAAAGPLVGGALLEHFWWGSVFLLNIPLMALAVPLGRWLLPESTGRATGPWDAAGALLAAAGLFCAVLAVKRVGDGQLLSPATAALLAAGAGLLTLFVRRQRARKHPLVDFSAFARPAFGTAVGCIVLTVLALVGLALLAAQYLQLVLGLSPLQTGLRLLPLSVAAIAAGLAGPRLLRALGPRTMVVCGFVATALAVLSLTTLGLRDDPAVCAGAFVLLGLGLETVLFGCYESMLSDAPPERAGGAAAIGETAYQLGAGLGIAVLGSVMNRAYGSAVTAAPGVPPGAADAAARSLGEAYAVAAGLDGAAGELLRDSARLAFVQGLHVTLLVSAGLLLAGALAALRLPRTASGVPPAAPSLPAARSGAPAVPGAPEEGPQDGAGRFPAPSAPADGPPLPSRVTRP
ncbi:MFS transporter [Streptomyces sp. TRM 70351]|uniref:MFS transporter n=1 Tax=Streptomyces sp. TRM 70351 TaxID=3116552 RepID=UPI002E7B7A9D|nr:MFS transporter [Streptomyces sp. TRM 70351]MEE1929269.1 MFS transporter [Streptomyces sp. TRM 70351]